MSAGTILLTRRDGQELLDMDACIDAVECAFRAHAEGRVLAPGVLGAHVDGGGFHVKTAGLSSGARGYFAAKVNANFPGNRERHGLPTIQGVIALFDVGTGRPLALLDSAEITSVRTAAATAVAARYLARSDSAVVAVCGCGVQGRAQLRALTRVLPIRTALAFDADHGRAEEYAATMRRELGLEVRAVGDVRPGAFVAAVGADNPEKQEIDPALMASSTVVVDSLDQCATIGDLHHALAAGLMTAADVRAELGEIVAGRKLGRASLDDTIVFDSTGTALQDVAAAALVYERAVAEGRGMAVDLGSSSVLQ